MSSDVHKALWIRGIHANGYLMLNYQTLFMRSKLRHQLKRSHFKHTTHNLKFYLWPIFYNPGLFFKSPQNYFNLSGAVAPLIVHKVENCIWQMRALWSERQDSVVFSITQSYLIRGICLSEGPQSLAWSATPPQADPLRSLLPFQPLFKFLLSFSLSLFLSLPLHRCTSAPTASSPTQTWIASECTWWHNTLSSPCCNARYARTCSTIRSTCSSTSHTSIVWLLIAWTSLLLQ